MNAPSEADSRNPSTAFKAMRDNVRYAAALEQIMVIVGPGHPIYGIAHDALKGITHGN